ncbi:DUF695 domain-containing protein [Zobellella maritima]|uniref:DUF695 domain-containing protein n=1 Tax=Zobellella maritima TaxID=2059725 RepID=UPI000E30A69A|nr:DUF695 domain-containing protein [Zobellella maritima]
MTHSADVKGYRVVIPEETHTLVEFNQNDLPGVATINSALVSFEPKEAFAWHLSIMIEAKELGDYRMPTPLEQKLLYDFEDTIEPTIKANGNALFLARVTHDGRRELVYRIYDPKPLNSYLQNLTQSKAKLRPFEFQMEPDEHWEKASWFIQSVSR